MMSLFACTPYLLYQFLSQNLCTPPPPTPYPGDVIFEQPFIKYYLKNVLVKTMFTLTIYKILLFEGRSVLGPARRVPGSERVQGLKG